MKHPAHSTAKRLILLLPLLLCLLPASLWAAPPHERMREHTVRVICTGPDMQPHFSSGSGFVVDEGRHVVTNHHVLHPHINGRVYDCAPPFIIGFLHDTPGGTAGGNELINALRQAVRSERVKLIPAATAPWQSEQKDLAILKLDTAVTLRPVQFAAKSTVERGAHVVAVGFPGSADMGMNESFFEPTTTSGVVSRVLSDERRGGRAMIQVDAAVNQGNSGGPLFNEFGQVIGVNSEGPDRLQVDGDNIARAVSTDELREGFSALGIPFNPARSKPGRWRVYWEHNPEIVIALGVLSLMLLGMLYYMIATKSGREATKELTGGVSKLVVGKKPWDPPDEPPLTDGQPVLRILTGRVNGMPPGSSVPLDQGKIVIGRDPRGCQLVINDPGRNRVSRRHCVVGYSNGQFYVEDDSTNGTLLEDDRKIPPKRRHKLRPGTRFMLASHDFMFEVDYKR